MSTLTLDRTSTELPLPLVRWLEVAWPDGIDRVETLVLSGPLRIRRGRLWMPGDATMKLSIGEGYVSDLRIGIGPLTAVRGLDAFVDGTGLTRVGRATSVGHEIDQGAFLALWAQSILFPAAWARTPGVRWTPVDDTRVQAEIAFEGGVERVAVSFDPDASAFPSAYEADRFKVVGGARIPWRVDYGEWHWLEGIALPTRMVVTWGDEPGPWFDMRVVSAQPNAPVAEDFARARAAIAATDIAAR